MSLFDTSRTLGGSPTAVDVPPMLANITSAINTCLGSRSRASHSLDKIQRKTKLELFFGAVAYKWMFSDVP